MPLRLDRSSLLRELIQIGIGLTSERDLALLPARILTAARRFTHAEAGTLYLRDGDRLRFAVVQNDVLARRLGEREMQRLFESHLPLSVQSLAGYVALSGNVLRVSDVYEIPTDRPYAFNRAFDAETGYRTQSVLVVPLKEPAGNVIGVFQLINALDARTHIVPFDPDYEELIRALASQATVAVRNAQLEEVARGRAALRFVASLATAMAHEINNPLMVIKGNVQLLVRETSDPVSRQRLDAVLGAVDSIHEVVERMHRITELKLADQSRAEEWWGRYVAVPLPTNITESR
jgi:GAF domain-containing protein